MSTPNANQQPSQSSSGVAESCAARVEIYAKYYIVDRRYSTPYCDLPYGYGTVELPKENISRMDVTRALVETEKCPVDDPYKIEVDYYSHKQD